MQEAHLLGRPGRTGEAGRSLRQLVAERPAAPAPRIALVDRLEADGRLEESLALLLGSSVADSCSSDLPAVRSSPVPSSLPALSRTGELAHGAHGHMDSTLLDSGWKHARWLASISERAAENREVFIEHYRRKYDDPYLPPL